MLFCKDISESEDSQKQITLYLYTFLNECQCYTFKQISSMLHLPKNIKRREEQLEK